MGSRGGVLWATCGGPGRPLEASTRGVFDRVPPRGSQRSILDDFGSILSGILEQFSRCLVDFARFSHNVHWIFNGFCENVRGNRERKAETELRQFTSCLMCCSHQCPTSRGGLSEAITMRRGKALLCIAAYQSEGRLADAMTKVIAKILPYPPLPWRVGCTHPSTPSLRPQWTR